MKQIITKMVLVLVACSSALAHDILPVSSQKGAVALVNVTIHPVSSESIPRGTILFEGGKIVALGASVDLPEGATQIDLEGKHIYPGLISACLLYTSDAADE